MVTAKKTTSKKPAARAKVSAKTAVKSKDTPSKSTRKRSVLKRASNSELRSFRIVKEDVPFTSFRITRQTIYWVILVAFIIFAQLWIIKLQVDVAALLDAQQAQLQQL